MPQAAEERAKGCLLLSVLLGTASCEWSDSARSLPWQRSALILHSRLGCICLECLLGSGLAVTPKLVDLGYEGHHS